MVELLVLTALSLEFEAVVTLLQNRRAQRTRTGVVLELGEYRTDLRSTSVAVAEVGVGNIQAATVTTLLLTEVEPSVTLFVGVAGGIKDVKLGDVVVATKVYGYESGKDEKSGFKTRPDVAHSSWLLQNEARALARTPRWRREEDLEARHTPNAYIGPICAGEKVVAARRSQTYKFVRKHYNDALAVEMEGRGFLESARILDVKAAIVRGISDLIDEKEDSDADGSQDFAANAAALFALELGLQFLAGFSGSRGRISTPGGCPYMGLRYFDVDDAQNFFGRESSTEHVLLTLHSLIRRGRPRLVGIVGASGSGKSSLARAGVLAQLRNGALKGSSSWAIGIVRPGSNPIAGLAQLIADLAGINLTIDKLVADLLADERILDHHLSTVNREGLVLLVDQLEEAFTLCPDAETVRAFLDNLAYAARRSDSNVVVIVTLRSDHYHRCAQFPDFGRLVAANQVLLSAMSRADLSTAIVSPAEVNGRVFESGLIDRILSDSATVTGPLPLLEYAMTQLWSRSADRTLKHKDYSEIGGMIGALIDHAESAYLSLSIEERSACRYLFLRISLYENTMDSRQPMLLSEIVPDGEDSEPFSRVVDVFSGPSVRLLIVDLSEEQKIVELTHESLLHNWPRLRGWLEADREAHAFYSQLSRDARAWRQGGHEPHQLMSTARLRQASEWLSTDSFVRLSRMDREYLDASVSNLVRRLLDAPDSQIAVELAEFQQAGSLLANHARALLIDTVSESATRRLRLALLAADSAQIFELREDLLKVAPSEFSILLEAIGQRIEQVAEFMWTVAVADNLASNAGRLIRAACVLARVQPADERWTIVVERLAEALVTESALTASQWFVLLKPIDKLLTGPLGVVAASPARDVSHQLVAASGISSICGSPRALATVMIDCEGPAHEVLFGGLTAFPDIESALDVLDQASKDEVVVGQDDVGIRRRATAIFDLLRIGAHTDVEACLGVTCPEDVASYLAQRMRRHGAPVDHVLAALSLARSGTTRRRLVLALGSIPSSEAPADLPAAAFTKLVEDSIDLADSGLRASAEWALDQFEPDRPSVRLPTKGSPQGESCEAYLLHVGSIPLRLVRFGSGNFTMGSPLDEYLREGDEVQHLVEVDTPFAIMDRPISEGLIELFRSGVGQRSSGRDRGAGDLVAATDVSWNEAASFCEWLNSAVRSNSPSHAVPQHEGESIFRLPTEAEWEFACRSGTSTKFSFGDDLSLLPNYAWFVDNSLGAPQRVGTLMPNPRGLFDIHGNVYEWCQDWYGPYAVEACRDPAGPALGDRRVVRGGCWFFEARFCRSAYRGDTRHPNIGYSDVGFRVACDLSSLLRFLD